MPSITPCLWFNHNAEEAVNTYISILPQSTINKINRYSKVGYEFHQQEAGSVMTLDFELLGKNYIALNGGPHFKANPSLSLMLHLRSEEEVEKVWQELSQNANIRMPLDRYMWSRKYGWLQDRFGIEWQIVYSSEQEGLFPTLLFTDKVFGKTAEALDFYAQHFQSKEEAVICPNTTDDMIEFAQVELCDREFVMMDTAGEHNASFNEYMSFMLYCDTQEEIDHHWETLSKDGQKGQCSWLKDKFGVSWQIVPSFMREHSDPYVDQGAERAMAVVMKSTKLNIEEIKKAYHSL